MARAVLERAFDDDPGAQVGPGQWLDSGVLAQRWRANYKRRFPMLLDDCPTLLRTPTLTPGLRNLRAQFRCCSRPFTGAWPT